MIGKTIFHFKILEKLGEGGMGIVYKAEDTKLKRYVAVKFLPRQITINDKQHERFKIEAQAAAALNHPNITTIHAIEEIDDELFIVMEYIDGQELKQKIDAGQLNVDRFLDITSQIADGLHAAHERGIVHRDIKSTNVMVTGNSQVKIMDFGLAKLSGRTQVTKEGTAVGTVAYMSPEQTEGENVDHRTDIWSLGVVLYEMITGQLPFKSKYEQAVIYSILNEDPKPITDLRTDVTDELRQVVDKALSKSPDERYQLVEELLTDLRAIGGKKAVPGILPLEHHTVGREKELAELKAGFQVAATGRGLLMCVAGEPGIGKTTLVEEFLNEVSIASLSCTIARGRCSERLAGTEAYLPFLEVLESLLKSQANGSMTKIMREMAPWWYAQVALLSDDDSSDVRLYEGVKTTTQERMKRELAAFLQEVSRAKPLILFFDDLHWSDVSTIDLLSYLASKFETMRMLILTTYHPSELLLTKHPFLQIKPDLHRIKGELLLMQDEDEAEVEKCFLKALDVAQAQSARSLELRAAMSLSRLWQKQGKQKEAGKMLKEIYGWFTEGFDTADLKEAKALLGKLS